MLLGDPIAERGPLLPCRRDRVAGVRISVLSYQSRVCARLSWTQISLPLTVHWPRDGAGQRLRIFAGMRPLTGAAKSNGLEAIQTGSLACWLKMTSGQPLPVRFQSWIFACSVVAPLESPS